MPPERLEALYDEHAAGLFRYARSILANEQAAKDVLQEVFVKLARSGLPEVENEKAWLYRLAHNAAIDQIRRSATRREYDRASRDESGAAAPGGPESDPDRAELGRQLDAAVALLPREQQSVARLRLWQEMTFQEIATIQGIPLNTAASRFRYALETLRGRLKPLYEELK
jgi:RNA polymerase sigma-70 factor (ECF subfamily)